VPLNLVYNSGGKGGSFFIGGGPSLGIGFSGKAKGTSTSTIGGSTTTTTSEQKIVFDGKENANDNDGHAKPFEFGVNALLGYKFTNGLFINANYNQGLSSIAVDKDESFKNMYIGLNIGFFLTK
jgi:hypothetical protein